MISHAEWIYGSQGSISSIDRALNHTLPFARGRFQGHWACVKITPSAEITGDNHRFLAGFTHTAVISNSCWQQSDFSYE